MAEQGIPGLLLWCAFLIWLFRRPAGSRSDPSYKGRSLAWLFCLISFATAPLGLGMLDAVPSTETLLMLMGWFAAPEPTSGARTGESHSWLGRGLYTRGVSRQSREHALAQLFSVYCSATANGNQKY